MLNLNLIKLFHPLSIWLLLFIAGIQCLSAQYTGDRDRYRAQDALNPMPQNAVLFVGSSSIRLWEGLSQEFPDYNIIQRGFGGSTIGDLQNFAGSNGTSTAVNALAKNVVQFYNPRAVVVWSGTNDVRPGQSGAYVASGFQNFVSLVTAQLPNTHIFYLGITKNPHYLGDSAANQRRIDANTLIQAFVANSGNPNLHYIDLPAIFESLSNSTTPAMWDYYVDSLHTNKAGYALWTTKIRADLAAAGILPDKTYQPNPQTPAPGQKILFDFGANDTTNGIQTTGVDANGNRWNNWHSIVGTISPQAGEHIGNLTDTTGANTGIKMAITGPFTLGGNASEKPLTQNATALGDLSTGSAAQDFFKWSGNYPAGFYLSGLDPARAYELRFLGSKNGTSTHTTRFTATGAKTVSADLTTSGAGIGDGGVNYNTRNVAVLTEIVPNTFGEIHVDLTPVQGSEAHLNAMQLVVLSKQPTTITAAPTASSLIFGQRLSNSTLTGGSATGNGTTIPGTFAFANPQNMPPVGNSTQTVIFTPADSGNFTTAIAEVTLSVAPNPNAANKILIDFGSDLSVNANYLTVSPDTNGNYWNNYKTNNGTLSNLVFTDNSTTGIALAGVNTVAGAASGGWGIANGTVNLSNSNLNIFTAYTDGIYVFSGNSTLTFSGLDPSKKYSFELFGSRSGGNATVASMRSTQYTFTAGNGNFTQNLTTTGNNTGSGGANYNTSNSVVFTNLFADGSNQIKLRLEGAGGQTSGSYINALQITVDSGNSEILAPPTASPLVYGKTLSNSTLSGGNASVPGTFAFASPLLMPPVGNSTQTVVFTPTDTGNYTAATANISISVSKATPVVQTFPSTSVITFGEPAGNSTLSGGNASVPGSFAFASPADLPVLGTSQHVVVFTPSDSGNYTNASILVDILAVASRETPLIQSPPVASHISFGQSLANSTLSGGGASVPGSFAFANPQTTPPVGTSSHAVVFTPTDSANYTTATTNSSVQVNKALPTITISPVLGSMVYGQTLGSGTLGNGMASVPGTFAFANPQSAPPIGNSTQSVVFTPTDTGNYTTAVFNISITVNPGAVGPFLVDFGPATGTTTSNAGQQWNNMTTSSSISLTDISGNLTNAMLSFVAGGAAFQVNGPTQGDATVVGTLSPSPSLGRLAVAAATQDFFYASTTANFSISGLSPSGTYTLRLFGSRNATETRTTTFSATGAGSSVTANLTTSGSNIGGTGIHANTSNVAVLSGIQPDGTGKITLRVSLAAGLYSYLNAMEIFVQDPDIALEYPEGTSFQSGNSVISLGALPVGDTSTTRTVFVKNTGLGPLSTISLSKNGSAVADFTLGALSSNSVAVGANATFTIFFNPSASGNRTAQILVGSNDPDENPFAIQVSGIGLSVANDTDGDGLNDVAEYRYASLGFDWQTANATLVNTLKDHANTAGLYSTSQMQALQPGMPVLSRNAATGVFTLKFGLQKSTNLQTFQPMPFTQNGTFVNPATGEIEFDFTAPDNAAFFRLQAK